MESSSAAAAGSAAMATKPKPKDFSHYYSITTAHRVPSAMKAYYKFFQIPGIGNLAGGKQFASFTMFIDRHTIRLDALKPYRSLAR